MITTSKVVASVFIVMAFAATSVSAQVNMPNRSQVSGVPLPAPDLPAGTVSVRVARGTMTNGVPNQLVEFDVDGKKQTLKTDDAGRAQVSGLRVGAQFQASTVLDGKTLVTQSVTIGGAGIKFALVGEDAEINKREEEDRALAAGPAVKGLVVFGPETRVVAEYSDDRLNIFYGVEIVNTARTPVDIGGPVVLDLPRGARGAAILPDSSRQATAIGSRITVTGPFAPGSTVINVGFEMPFNSATVRLEQALPIALQQVTVLVVPMGPMDVRSAQIAAKRRVNDRGQDLIVGTGPALPAGQSLVLEITGLPHYPEWPRIVALTLAGLTMGAGIWAAVFNVPRRRTA